MEGIELVIRPRHIERLIYGIVIITLVILLIIKWDGSPSGAVVNETLEDVEGQEVALENSGINSTNQTESAVIDPTDTCHNGVKDSSETDVDCGGSCDGCEEFLSCNVDSDCASNYCHQHIKCLVPTCDDGIKNQDESNIDCGGVCGGYYYDSACHDKEKVTYSGRIDLRIDKVATSVTSFGDNEYAKVESVKFTVENGKDDNIALTAYVFLRDSTGSAYFENGVTGDEYDSGSLELTALALGEKTTQTIEIKRTLPSTDPDEKYQVIVDIRDADGDSIKTAKWTNS